MWAIVTAYMYLFIVHMPWRGRLFEFLLQKPPVSVTKTRVNVTETMD